MMKSAKLSGPVLFSKERCLFYLLFGVLVVCLHLPFRSLWLDDQDSIHFALAIEELNLVKHQPHPPGYAAYIYTARLLDVVFGDPQKTLTYLSLLAGSLCIPIVYSIGKKTGYWQVGAVAAAVMLVAPVRLQMTLVAMNDIVALFFLLLSIRLALSREGGWKWASLLSGLALGWTIGVRPQWIIVGGVFAVFCLIYKSDWRDRIQFLIGGLVGTFAWLIPISLTSGGFGVYLKFASNQYNAHPDVREKFSMGDVATIFETFSHRWEFALDGLLLLAVIFLLIGSRQVRSTLRERKGVLIALSCCLLWFALATLSSLLFHPVSLHRVTVPMIPPFSLVLGLLIGPWIWRKNEGWIRLFSTCSLVVVLAFQGTKTISQAYEFRNSVPAPVQLIDSLRDSIPVENALLVQYPVPRFFQWYGSDFEKVVNYMSPTFFKFLNSPEIKYVVSPYALGFQKPFKTFSTERPYRLYSAHSKSIAYIYRTRDIAVLPVSGFHGREKAGIWTKDEFSANMRSRVTGETDLRLSIRSGLGVERRLEIEIDGETHYSGIIGLSKEKLEIPLPLADEWKLVTFKTPDGCLAPSEISDSTDQRCLSFFIDSFSVGPQRLHLGDRLQFTPGRSALGALDEGWSSPESDWVWSSSSKAQIDLLLNQIPEEVLVAQIEGHFFLGGEEESREVDVFVNDVLLSSYSVSSENQFNPIYRIPMELISSKGELSIRFEFQDSRSPQSMGLSGDPRLLGLSLTSLTLLPASEVPGDTENE